MVVAWIVVLVAVVTGAFFLWQGSTSDKINFNVTQMESSNIEMDSIPEEYRNQQAIYRTLDRGDKYSSPNGMMLYNDGMIFRYSDMVAIKEKGSITMKKGNLEWRKEAKIKGSAIKQVLELTQRLKPDEISETDLVQAVEIQLSIDGETTLIFVDGTSTPNNYKLFTDINRIISLNVIQGAINLEEH